jgi:hypothetical protein
MMYHSATLADMVVRDTRRSCAHYGPKLSPPLGRAERCSCWVHIETHKTLEVSWHCGRVCRACLAHDRSWRGRPGLLLLTRLSKMESSRRKKLSFVLLLEIQHQLFSDADL